MFINFKTLITGVSAAYILFTSQLTAHEYSLDEKIGQILIVCCPSSELNQECETLISEINVGGFIYYSWANPLNSKEKLKELTNVLQTCALNTKSKLPLFISIDQEGGVVSRLSDDFTLFPGNYAIGKASSYKLCQKAAEAMASEMRFAGINLNFSPVVDVIDDRTIPYIGFRSFGSDPKKVTQFASSMLKGFRNKGLLGTLKHFPGHGSAKKDSHVELPVIEKSLDELKKQDLVPFKELKNQTDFIMTAHILVPCLDAQNPVTISKKALDFLKKDMGYKGLIVSDSLTMDGLLKTGLSIESAAVKAFIAGCDLLLIGGRKLNDGQNSTLSISDIKAIKEALKQGVLKGEISQERLNESFEKILKVKKKLAITSSAQGFSKTKHQKISNEIAQKALHYHFKPEKGHLFNHYFLMTSKDMQRKLLNLEKDLQFLSGRIFFDQKLEHEHDLIDSISHKDLVIFLSKGLKKNNYDEQLYKKLLENNKSVFLIDLSENELRSFNAVGIIQTNNPQESSLELAIHKFKQELRLNN